MILDKLKLATTIFQIQYADSFDIWDSAGTIAKQLSKIWPG